jgi:hypothetical protein
LLTLSQIQAWDVDHLIEAAEHWDSSADRWDTVYGQVWQESLGMDWQGEARDALIDRTTTDKAMVNQKSDQLREAALTARRGAGDISALQRAVLYKVDDAHQAGFVVGEDFSVTDTKTSRDAAALAARQAQAQSLSADIRSRAAQLSATDSEVGSKLTAGAGDVGSLTFAEQPIPHNGNGKISAVDWKQAPAPAPGPGPTAQDARNAIKDLPRGTKDNFFEIRSEQDLRNYWNWISEGATERPNDRYSGTEKVMKDGTIIGIRESEKHGPTVEIHPPNDEYQKIHVNTERGGVPEIPGRTAGPPEVKAAEAPRPAPEPAPMGPAGTNPLPHFVAPPHSHRGPPILGRSDLSDPEFESP